MLVVSSFELTKKFVRSWPSSHKEMHEYQEHLRKELETAKARHAMMAKNRKSFTKEEVRTMFFHWIGPIGHELARVTTCLERYRQAGHLVDE